MSKRVHIFKVTLPQDNAVFGEVTMHIGVKGHEEMEAGNHLTQVLQTLGLRGAETLLLKVMSRTRRTKKEMAAAEQVSRGVVA